MAAQEETFHWGTGRKAEGLDEDVKGHGDIPKQQNPHQPADPHRPGALFVSDPTPEEEESEVGVKKRGDEPRMTDDFGRDFPQGLHGAGPAGDGEHGDEDENGEDAEGEEHGRARSESLLIKLLPDRFGRVRISSKLALPKLQLVRSVFTRRILP